MRKENLPSYDELMNPLLLALKSLGGSATIEELETKVAGVAGISNEQLEIPHDPETGGRSEFGYRLAWSRTYLKRYGLVENSGRGVWALTSKGNKSENVDEKDVVRFSRESFKVTPRKNKKPEPDEYSEVPSSWREELAEALLKIKPDPFERLVQRLLRESGFIQVEVTAFR